jgi:prepilin-type processing-associated H-X9-DG protein
MAMIFERTIPSRGGRDSTRPRVAFTIIELLMVIGVIAMLIAILLPAIQSSRELARRAQCTNNLLQIGTALGSYASTHSVLPPGVVNDKGPISNVPVGYHFGWAVQILPFFDQPAIFHQFDFSQSVYAPSNDTARGHRIASFLCPSCPIYGLMSYAACHNDVEAPIDAGNHGVFYLNSRTRYDDITDGPAFTIFVGEYATTPGPGWAVGTSATLRNAGTPINEVDPLEQSLLGTSGISLYRPLDTTTWNNLIAEGKVSAGRVGGFRSYHKEGSNFLFGDGSVRYLQDRIDPDVYRSLAHRADGNLISADEF